METSGEAPRSRHPHRADVQVLDDKMYLMENGTSVGQRYEQDIDRSAIAVVCQPTPLPKLGISCLRFRGYF